MSDDIQKLFEQNRAWAEGVEADDPGFFERLSQGQSPKYLWLGCADSRVPETQLMGLAPGDVFVHRNIANVFKDSDNSAMSVLQFAVTVVGVRHVIVCGHYGCAGVKAGMDQNTAGPVDEWLGDMRDLYDANKDSLSDLDPADAQARMCEMNVKLRVQTIGQTSVLQETWANGQAVDVHGWIYDLKDGLIKDLGYHVASAEDVNQLVSE